MIFLKLHNISHSNVSFDFYQSTFWRPGFQINIQLLRHDTACLALTNKEIIKWTQKREQNNINCLYYFISDKHTKIYDILSWFWCKLDCGYMMETKNVFCESALHRELQNMRTEKYTLLYCNSAASIISVGWYWLCTRAFLKYTIMDPLIGTFGYYFFDVVWYIMYVSVMKKCGAVVIIIDIVNPIPNCIMHYYFFSILISPFLNTIMIKKAMVKMLFGHSSSCELFHQHFFIFCCGRIE